MTVLVLSSGLKRFWASACPARMKTAAASSAYLIVPPVVYLLILSIVVRLPVVVLWTRAGIWVGSAVGVFVGVNVGSGV